MKRKIKMNDMWGKEAKVGDVFVHPLRRSSSVWTNKYEIVSIEEAVGRQPGKVKARCLNKDSWAYKVWEYIPGGNSHHRDMTEAERAKVDAKTVTISTFSRRSTIL
jgi:hypothetical protein